MTAWDKSPHGLGRPSSATSADGVTTAFAYDDVGDAPGRTVVFNELDLPKTITTAAGLTSFSSDAAGAGEEEGPRAGKSQWLSTVDAEKAVLDAARKGAWLTLGDSAGELVGTRPCPPARIWCLGAARHPCGVSQGA